jgi:2-hydroxy-6-oxonona-2,4-dienedioate hydrolase/4,5:9,10-diseco-3-hydroxy-5,9,17-trioxoandrosta-1(10),2-diene-4-oate hydrolase
MTPTAESRSVRAGGCDIHYLELGAGPNLVFLHGSGGLRWDEDTFAGLSGSYRLLVPSMPGFDQSTVGPAATGPDVADVMAEFIRGAVGGRAHLIGESFGGRIAAWTTVRHPDVVDRAVLAAPGGLRRSGGDRGLNLSPEEREIRLYGRVMHRDATPEAQAQHRANVLNATNFGGPPWDEDLYQQLPSVQRPVLVLYGSNDQTLQRDDVALFHERMPGSRITIVEGAPHVISATCPEQFLSLVKAFLSES